MTRTELSVRLHLPLWVGTCVSLHFHPVSQTQRHCSETQSPVQAQPESGAGLCTQMQGNLWSWGQLGQQEGSW